MEGPPTKRVRGPNFAAREQSLLSDLVFKYRAVLENKCSDAATNRMKEECWKTLAQEFNSASDVKRQWQQLRSALDNLKRKAKKNALDDHLQQCKAGGGTYIRKVDAVSEKLLVLLWDRVTPLPS